MSDAAVPTPAELSAAVRGLEKSRDALLARCAALRPADWERSDGPGRWSVAQILEHMIIVERGALRAQEKMQSQPPEADWEARTGSKDTLLTGLAVARQKVVAPAQLQPQGGLTPEALLADFAAARAATLAFAVKPNQRLKEHTREHLFDGRGPQRGFAARPACARAGLGTP